MRKSLYGLFFAVFLVGFVAATGARGASIVNTGHDLNTLPGSITITGTNGRICIFCHTPHGARTEGAGTEAPLWWRLAPASPAWAMYDSDSMDATPPAAPQGVSLACLSCHDGASAFDALVFQGGIAVTDPGGNPANMFDLGFISSILAVGPNLSNDHPISITYGADAELAPVSELETAGLPLYGAANDQVECATCHMVHDDQNGRFLRMYNGASALCLTCHVK